jgi:hypothetical protein
MNGIILLNLRGVTIRLITAHGRGIVRTSDPAFGRGKVMTGNTMQVIVGVIVVTSGVLLLLIRVQLGDELTTLTVGFRERTTGVSVPGLLKERIGCAGVRREIEGLHTFLEKWQKVYQHSVSPASTEQQPKALTSNFLLGPNFHFLMIVQIAKAPTITLATTMIAIIAVFPTLSFELPPLAAAAEAEEVAVERVAVDLTRLGAEEVGRAVLGTTVDLIVLI